MAIVVASLFGYFNPFHIATFTPVFCYITFLDLIKCYHCDLIQFF